MMSLICATQYHSTGLSLGNHFTMNTRCENWLKLGAGWPQNRNQKYLYCTAAVDWTGLTDWLTLLINSKIFAGVKPNLVPHPLWLLSTDLVSDSDHLSSGLTVSQPVPACQPRNIMQICLYFQLALICLANSQVFSGKTSDILQIFSF